MSGGLDLIAFAGVMALGQFSPGPDMILLTRTALKEGAGAGVRMALGIGCGLAVHAGIAVAGLALVYDRYPQIALFLRWGAAGYLLWLAYQIGRECLIAWRGAICELEVSPLLRGAFLRGLFCNLLNPKAAIFLAAVCAPFLRGNHPGWWPVALWMIVVVQGWLLWSLWAVLLQWRPLRNVYQKLGSWIDGIFAVVLLALAVYLMVG